MSAIGIAYQMHGLVLVDKDHNLLAFFHHLVRFKGCFPGEHAMNAIGNEQCLSHLLNSPGNFTASKLSWVIDE